METKKHTHLSLRIHQACWVIGRTYVKYFPTDMVCTSEFITMMWVVGAFQKNETATNTCKQFISQRCLCFMCAYCFADSSSTGAFVWLVIMLLLNCIPFKTVLPDFYIMFLAIFSTDAIVVLFLLLLVKMIEELNSKMTPGSYLAVISPLYWGGLYVCLFHSIIVIGI